MEAQQQERNMHDSFHKVEFLSDQQGDWAMDYSDEYLDAGRWGLVYGQNAAANMDGGDCCYMPIMPAGA